MLYSTMRYNTLCTHILHSHNNYMVYISLLEVVLALRSLASLHFPISLSTTATVDCVHLYFI